MDLNPGHSIYDISPDNQVIQSDTETIIKDILSSLPSLEQLIVNIHFYHGKTLEETTRILKQKNVWQVRRKLQKVLNTLKIEMKKRGLDVSDFDFL